MAEIKNSIPFEVDIMDFGRLLLKKIVWMFLMVIIGIGIAFGISYNQKQTYKASALLYTNNYRSTAQDLIKYITSSDISASRSLIDVYSIIIKTRETLNDDFIKELNSDPELSRTYNYSEISKMIQVGSKNDTEILQVSVIGDNQDDVIIITNAVARVSKLRIESIIQGTNVEIVEEAWYPSPISKGTTKKCITGGIIGFIVYFVIMFVYYLLNNDIESEDWLIKNYENRIPILAIVPDSVSSNKKRYGYGKYRNYSNYENYEKKDD